MEIPTDFLGATDLNPGDDDDIVELIQEQERIAKRSLQICALLRDRCKLEAPRWEPDVSQKELQRRPEQPAPRRKSPVWKQRLSAGSELREPLMGGGEKEPTPVPQASHRIFHNKDAMKEEIKARLADPPDAPHEHELYHDDGRMVVRIAKNKVFENFTFSVIILNMIWIGVDADYNHAEFLVDAPTIFQVVENLFCLYFSFEICVRFLSFKHKSDCLFERWFMFDSFLVALMVWDVWIMNSLYIVFDSGFQTPNTQALRVLRLFRLMRVARMARVVRTVPEFMILAKGVGLAVRSVFSTLCLMVVIMYVFAILFTELLSESDAGKGCFETVAMSMNCLMVNAVFADQANIIDQVLKGGIAYYFFLIVFLVLTTMTVLNMLIGVMCELIGTTAEFEREALVADHVRENVKKVLPTMDSDGDGMISEEEFVKILDSPEAMAVLTGVDVDVIALVDFADYIFRGRSKISFEDFMQTVLKFRGGQQVTVKDLVDVREFLSGEIRDVAQEISKANKDQTSRPGR